MREPDDDVFRWLRRDEVPSRNQLRGWLVGWLSGWLSGWLASGRGSSVVSTDRQQAGAVGPGSAAAAGLADPAG